MLPEQTESADATEVVEAREADPRAVDAAASGDPADVRDDPAADDAGTQGGPDPSGHPLVQDLVLNPGRWRIWPAVAVLRWLQRRMRSATPRLVFRSRPSLGFAGSEVHDIQLRAEHIDLVLNAPGLAASGSALPTADIARIVADYLDGGALAAWLDGPGDRFMHLLEDAQLLNNPAYALMAGDHVELLTLTADLVGRSAPLTAAAGGELSAPGEDQPSGALAFSGAFLGTASASGLRALFRAFTGLTTDVEEFAGGTVPIGRPARVRLAFGRMLGLSCELPSAGIAVHIRGGDNPVAPAWARDPRRRRSLHLLAASYIGAPSPEARLYLWLDPDNAPRAALDGTTAFGGLAVLGRSSQPVRLPIG